MTEIIYLGMGCFWGAQKYFDNIKGIINTEVGYLNGNSDQTTYEQVCNNSGHAEVVKLIYDPNKITKEEIFKAYIRVIDPFSKNKQGNDVGPQYRTGIYSSDHTIIAQFKDLLKTWELNHGKSEIEIDIVKNYIVAEVEHQKYLEKNINGYCHINLSDIPEELKK